MSVSGIRRAELVALRISDIDSKLMVLHIREGKGQRDRDLPMTPRLLEALRAAQADTVIRRPSGNVFQLISAQ